MNLSISSAFCHRRCATAVLVVASVLCGSVGIPALLSDVAFAEGTRLWEQSKFDDLQKGTAKDIAIRHSGGFELAPALKPLYVSPSTQIWAIASDSAGNVYAAAGSPARVYRVTPDGKASIVFESQDLQVQALAIDKAGSIYAATLPDGKVFRIQRNAGAGKSVGSGSATVGDSKPMVDTAYTSEVFFDPKTKYIWSLLLDDSGNLFVATGDSGSIFRVTPAGASKLFFKSDEAHIRALAWDGKGNLIAGSDGSGLIYRISSQGEGFVLYGAGKKEITALAVDHAGNVYAAAVGEKRSTGGIAVPLLGSQPVTISVTTSPPHSAPGTTAAGGSGAVAGPLPLPAVGATGGSEIYRIAPDGSPERIWGSNEDIAYALAFAADGELLVGTGNKGRILGIASGGASEDNLIDLGRAAASQVTAFTSAPGGGIYAATSNLGKVFSLGPKVAPEGSLESDVFDAHIFSRWGRAEVRGSNVELFARSGNVDNPDRNWSPWSKVDLAGTAQVNAPAGRYLQWKAVLHPGNGKAEVNSVAINYLPKNIAPVIDDVTVQVGTRITATPRPSGGSTFVLGNAAAAGYSDQRYESPLQTVHDRDAISVKWNVHDVNDDQLTFSVYYRGEGDSRWLLLRDEVSDKWITFDAALLPDGAYEVKVKASDADSHSPGEGLRSEKESARFEVDTTAPRIEELKAVMESGKIHVSFRATDSFSVIKHAEYSLDAGDWQFLEPVGELSDAKSESYDFRTPLKPNPGTSGKAENESEHVVVVRVYDRFDNMATAKDVLKGTASHISIN